MKKLLVVLRWLFGLGYIFVGLGDIFIGDVHTKQRLGGTTLGFIVFGLYLLPPVTAFLIKKMPKSLDFGHTFNRVFRYVFGFLFYVFLIYNSYDLNSIKKVNKEQIEVEKKTSVEKKTPKDHKSGAYLTAEDYVKAKLSYPEEADFPWNSSIPTVVNGDMYKVQGYVNTKNGFGVKVKVKFVCVLKYIGGEGGDDLSPSSWEEQATTVFE